MNRTWIVGVGLLLSATAVWAQERRADAVDTLKSYTEARAADVRTEPPPGETLPVPRDVKPSAASPSLLTVPLPQPAAAADFIPQAVPRYVTPQSHSTSILDTKESHLRKAAEHLKAAGLEDEAARYGKLADAEQQRVDRQRKERMLRQMEAELQLLQQEVDRLRAQVGSPQQVMLDIQVIELPIGKLRERAEESDIVKSLLEDIAELLPGVGRPGVVDAESKSLAALHTLLTAYGGKILADPKLVGTSGRPARFHQGGAFQVKIPGNDGETKSETRLFGTEVEFTPHMLSDGRIRLDVRVRLSDPERDQTGKVKNPPRLHVREFDTTTELSTGQVLVSAMTCQESTGTVASFFVIRPQRIEAMDVKLPSNSQPSPSAPPVSIPQ